MPRVRLVREVVTYLARTLTAECQIARDIVTDQTAIFRLRYLEDTEEDTLESGLPAYLRSIEERVCFSRY